MNTRILTKIIIILFSGLLYVVLFKKGIDQITVIAFLFAIILLAVTEIMRQYQYLYVLMVLIAGLGLVHPEFIIPELVLSYSLFSSDIAISDIVTIGFHEMNNKKNTEAYGRSVRRMLLNVLYFVIITIVMALGSYKRISMVATVLVCVMMLYALLLAIKDSMNCGLSKKYYTLFDDSRLEAMDLKRQRKEAFARNEEDVYMATLKERNRIAREIHDNVGHILTRAIVQMQAVKVINANQDIQPYLESVDETINQAMLNIRKSVHELHDDSVDLSVMVSECLKVLPASIKPELKTSIESAVSTDIKNTIIAVVREAVTNIAKYSNGDRAYVEIVEHSAFWRVLVKDNGANEKKDYSVMLRDKSADTGLGLMSIYQRVSKHDGNVNINSDEKGFQVVITLPKMISNE